MTPNSDGCADNPASHSCRAVGAQRRAASPSSGEKRSTSRSAAAELVEWSAAHAARLPAAKIARSSAMCARPRWRVRWSRRNRAGRSRAASKESCSGSVPDGPVSPGRSSNLVCVMSPSVTRGCGRVRRLDPHIGGFWPATMHRAIDTNPTATGVLTVAHWGNGRHCGASITHAQAAPATAPPRCPPTEM